MQGGSGDKVATHEAAAEAGRFGGFRPFAAGTFLAMRYGMRPSHRAIRPKP